MNATFPSARLLLIKSDGQFKHSGKYYLLNGRWHKLHADKPAPKGAAVAAHPHAAGAPVAGHAQLTEDEWSKLKLPAENSNAPTFNKQVEQLKAAAAAGDVTGILASGYGTNTYGKKLALIANHVLELMGSTHKVAPGQKAGAHAAVQTAPQIEAAQPAPAAPASEDAAAHALHTFTNTETNMQAKVVIGKNGTYNVVLQDLDSGEYVPTVQKYADEEKAIASAKSAAGVKDSTPEASWKPSVDEVMGLASLPKEQQVAKLKEWQSKLGSNAKLVQALEDAQAEAKKKAATGGAPKLVTATAEEPKAAPAPKKQYSVGDVIHGSLHDLPPGSVVSFDGGAGERKALIGKGNVWFDKVKGSGWQKNPLKPSQLHSFLYGDYAKESGHKVVSLGHEGWMHDAQKAQVNNILDVKNGKGGDAKAFHLGSSVVVGDIGKPHSFIWVGEDGSWGGGFSASDQQKLASGDGLKPVDMGAHPAASTEESIAMHRIMAPSMTNPAISASAFKGGNPVWYSQSNPSEIALSAKVSFMGSQPSEHAKKQYDLVQAAQAAGYSFTPYMKANGGKQGVYLLQKDGKVLTKKGAEALIAGGSAPAADAGPKEGDTKPAADGGVLVLKDGHWVKEEPAAAAPAGLAMPEFAEGKTTSGVKAYYEKVAKKIIDHAEAGNVAVLEGMPTSTGNTWTGKTPNSKKLLELYSAAMKSLGKDVAAPAPVPEPQETDKVYLDVPFSHKSKVKLNGAKWDADQGLWFALKGSDGEININLKPYVPDVNANGAKPTQGMKAAALNHSMATGVPHKVVSTETNVGTIHHVGHAETGKHPNEYVQKNLDAAAALLAAEKSAAAEAPAAPAEAPKKEPRLVIPKPSAAAPAPVATPAAGNSKLDQINWDGLKLPDSNSNAKSNNKQIEKIKALALAGDVAGLEDLKFGKNTYGKKQELLKQTALAALKEGGAPAPAAPVIPPPVTAEDEAAVAAMKAAKTPGEKIVDELKGAGFESLVTQQFGVVLGTDHGFGPVPKTYADNKRAQDAAVNLFQAGFNASVKGNYPYVVAIYGKLPEMVASTSPNDDMIAKIKAMAEGGLIGQAASSIATNHLKSNPGDVEGLVEELKAYGYQSSASALQKQLGGMHAESGPKDGDTKPAADGGTLVFKNGRWHKVGGEDAATNEPAPAATKPAKKLTKAEKEQATKDAVSAVALPDFMNADPSHLSKHYVGMAEKIKAAALADGLSGFKKLVTSGADGSFASKPSSLAFKTGKCYESSHPPRRALFWKFCNDIKAALESQKGPTKPSKPQPAAPAAAAPAPVTPSIEPMDSWVQTGPQKGSNPGGRFKDADGVEWYCKFPGDDDVAKSEVLAAKLYAALGLASQDAKLITKDGKIGIASRWVDVKKAGSPAALAATDGVAAGFAADAWLANWDVVGLGYDNLQIGADGKAVRIDAGGSLHYRAQGGKKQFGNVVGEIDSLRDPKTNEQAASVFGGLSQADITASVAKVLQLPDATIRALCFTHGPGSEADRKALADTLIARKADLAAKFPKAAKPTKKRLDPNNLPVDAKMLPKPHDFANWNGPGKGLSSQPHVNAANVAVEQEIIELARTGNLTKLKDFHFSQIDKNTGTATGLKVPIKNHPSKHVVQFHADLVQLLDEIANPPEPLKLFAEAEVSTLDALSAAFPPKPFGTTVSSVKSNEKLGFWVVLGGVADAHKFAPKKTSNFSTAAIQAAYQKYKEAKPLAKHFINSVQASGSYNDLFRDGKEKDGHGNSLTDVAKAALEVATEQPEGTSVYRWQKMTADMVAKVMSAPEGTVFQATGPMCTSYSPTATAGFGTHRVTVRYAKGAKAVESFGSGAFSSEKEVTTLPNSRFVILKKEMVPDVEHGNPNGKRLELEILMLPPDLGVA